MINLFCFRRGAVAIGKLNASSRRWKAICDVSEFGRVRAYHRGRHYRVKGYSNNKIIPELLQRTRHNGLISFIAPSCWSGTKGIDVPSSSLYLISNRSIHFTQSLFEEKNKPSSKVESSVKAIADELKEKKKKQVAVAPTPKRPLYKRIQDEILHYYHGFRLLFIDIRISLKLIYRILSGKQLSRREHKQLIRTTSDMFRLVPFSVFIIIPFMELLLPVFLKFFPGMLPSTFQTKNDRETKLKAELKVKLDMAKFLQQTLDDMALQGTGRSSQVAKDFAEFIHKIRTSGKEVTNEEILKYSKFFEDELTLDSLTRPQIVALCRVLEIPALGTTALLRFQLRMRLRYLVADDKVIQGEGVDSLDTQELQNACKVRGMRAVGVTDDRLRRQLNQWLELSLKKKVPPSLLLLSRAMFLPDNLPPTARLQATLSALPDSAALSTKASIGEKEGKVDNKTRIEILKAEEQLIKLEKQEQRSEKAGTKVPEVAKTISEEAEAISKQLKKAPGVPLYTSLENQLEVPLSTFLGPDMPSRPPQTVVDVVEQTLNRKQPMSKIKATRVKIKRIMDADEIDKLTAKDFEIIENAIDSLSAKKKSMLLESEELEDLKQEIADYEEDLKELNTVLRKAKVVKVKESTGARRLHSRLQNMITSLESVVQKAEPDKAEGQLVATEELIGAIRQLKNTEDPKELSKIMSLLTKLDDDKDGKIDLDDLVKVIDIVGRENVKITSKQLDEIVGILSKEELLEEKATTTKIEDKKLK